MLGLKRKESYVLSFSNGEVEEEDEFQIPPLKLCKTPSEEEMKKRKKISSLRKQYGIRFEEYN